MHRFLEDPTTFAVVGDWHMNVRWGTSMIRHLRGAGVKTILHTGDFGYTWNRSFLEPIQEVLEDSGMMLGFVDGNHEDFGQLLSLPVNEAGLRPLWDCDRIVHLPRGFRWQWAGVRFLALGGAHSVDRPRRVAGISWWPEETLTLGDVHRACEGGEVDVIVAHDCPSVVPIPGIDYDQPGPAPFDAAELAAARTHRLLLGEVVRVTEPVALWHGHYHRRYSADVAMSYGVLRAQGWDCDGVTAKGNVSVFDLAAVSAEVRGLRHHDQ